MKKYILFSFLLVVTIQLDAQKYFTKEGKISFYSDAPMEKIEAHNSKATAVLDLESGKMQWAVLIKAFQFEKALMQEHFNENYMESSKYPKATFTGSINDWTTIDLNDNAEHSVTLDGDLTIHGVTHSISTPAKLLVKNGELMGTAVFTAKVADYNIEIPGIVREKIAREVEIHIDANFQPLDTKS